MRSGPECDGIATAGVFTSLESCRVDLDDAQPTLVVHSFCPALRIGLIGTDRTNVVGLSVVIP